MQGPGAIGNGQKHTDRSAGNAGGNECSAIWRICWSKLPKGTHQLGISSGLKRDQQSSQLSGTLCITGQKKCTCDMSCCCIEGSSCMLRTTVSVSCSWPSSPTAAAKDAKFRAEGSSLWGSRLEKQSKTNSGAFFNFRLSVLDLQQSQVKTMF